MILHYLNKKQLHKGTLQRTIWKPLYKLDWIIFKRWKEIPILSSRDKKHQRYSTIFKRYKENITDYL